MSNMKLSKNHRNKDKVIAEICDPNIPSKRFIMNIPENLHTEFKLKCVSKGVTMKEIILEFIKEWIKK
ncbi:plasmid partition protein ParG [Arsenophonus nasoniae]|uniref:Plasmid partition protein ParG n=1 Tax=Arsenophonus nasoniae TaxID=638 RepID=A0AA95GGD3_9GAMM|nr:plasmid partition protein ParG [Arsenophonus nasoniae]WGL94091.1 plasmid partition protein ParG [Arsenophonus nasoniae]